MIVFFCLATHASIKYPIKNNCQNGWLNKPNTKCEINPENQ